MNGECTKEQVKTLWRLCFGDSEAFIDLYFRLRYDDDINVGIRSGEQLIAALQMLPYPLTFGGETVQTAYVSGACTHPDFRNRGVMRQLLAQAFARMAQGDALFSTLIPAEPWLFDYYRHMGYAPVFRRSTQKIDAPENADGNIRVERTETYEEDIFRYFSRKMSDRPCCIQHPEADFRVILADLSVSQGLLLVAKRQREVCGMLIAYRREPGWIVNEHFSDHPEVDRAMLHTLKKETGATSFLRYSPSDGKMPDTPVGMIRVVQAREVLQRHASVFPELDLQIALTDPQLSANNGFYALHKGQCTVSSEPLSDVFTEMSIDKLSEWVFRSRRPYMSLMMD